MNSYKIMKDTNRHLTLISNIGEGVYTHVMTIES